MPEINIQTNVGRAKACAETQKAKRRATKADRALVFYAAVLRWSASAIFTLIFLSGGGGGFRGGGDGLVMVRGGGAMGDMAARPSGRSRLKPTARAEIARA